MTSGKEQSGVGRELTAHGCSEGEADLGRLDVAILPESVVQEDGMGDWRARSLKERKQGSVISVQQEMKLFLRGGTGHFRGADGVWKSLTAERKRMEGLPGSVRSAAES